MMDHLISEPQLDACRLHRIMELGCGTGVCGAAWALRATSLGTPELVGMDINRWALTEAQATWKSVGLRGKTKLRSMVEFPKTEMQDAIVAGYSVTNFPMVPAQSFEKLTACAPPWSHYPHSRKCGETACTMVGYGLKALKTGRARGYLAIPTSSTREARTPRQSKRQGPLSS